MSKRSFITYTRNFIFGVEDSLVSTVGLLAGVAAAGTPRGTVILTGAVLVLVEAVSMAFGSFLSEQSAEEFAARTSRPLRQSVIAGSIMFGSYFFAGLIPLAPYIFMNSARAFFWSIGLSLAALFLLGACGARVFHISVFRHGARMLLLGGLAIGVGVGVGAFMMNV